MQTIINPKRTTPTLYPNISRGTLTDIPSIGFNPGSGVKVAVLDTGVNDDINVMRYDFTNTHVYDGMQFPVTHGTLVAAIIKHFARDAEVISIKVSPDGDVNYDTFVKGLLFAIQQGAQIVNASLGFPHEKPCAGDCDGCELIKNIVAGSGIILVNSVGNDGPKDMTARIPSMAENVVAVGMLTLDGLDIKPESSRGLPGIRKPNLVTSGYVDRFGLRDWGTSFAAPVIAGVMAAAYPAYHGDTKRLIEALYKSCVPFRKPPVHHQGHGVFSIKKFAEVIANETVVTKGQ